MLRAMPVLVGPVSTVDRATRTLGIGNMTLSIPSSVSLAGIEVGTSVSVSYEDLAGTLVALDIQRLTHWAARRLPALSCSSPREPGYPVDGASQTAHGAGMRLLHVGSDTPHCPRCGRANDVSRSRRDGLLDRLLGAVCVYPFRCLRCGRRFRRLQWGRRYQRESA